MKYLHIVPGAKDVANGMARVARLLAKEQGDAEVVDLSAVSGQSLAVSEGSESLGFVESLEEVWVHGMWLPKEWAICRRVIKAGKRLVRMTHGSLSPVYLKNQSPIKKWLVGPIERYWLRKADRIVATCDAEKAWVETYLGKRCPLVEVSDIKRFFKMIKQVRPILSFSEERSLHLLYLGRRHPLKGVEYLEAAVSELNSSNSLLPTPPLLKIVSNVFGDEKEKVWAWCDVLVLPTLSENFGLVIAEALERGKRVITTDGAPVWGDGNDYGGRLIYLKGYRGGTCEERVQLLKNAILKMIK